MSTAPSADFASRLSSYLTATTAANDVARYFAEPGQRDGTFTGRQFERLGGGGDHPEHGDRITAVDLVAVQMLSVTVPPETSVQLLDGPLGEQVSAHLRRVPTDVSLLDPEAAPHLAPGAPADECWALLEAAPGIGWVTAGKLLARKRPGLVPVYDDVVRCALGQPTKLWTTLHRALVKEPQLREALTSLRRHAPEHVSALRVLDVVVWMSHQQEHRSRCKNRAAAPDPGGS